MWRLWSAFVLTQNAPFLGKLQGSYGCWKSLKTLEFYSGIFKIPSSTYFHSMSLSDWRVHFLDAEIKVWESQIFAINLLYINAIYYSWMCWKSLKSCLKVLEFDLGKGAGTLQQVCVALLDRNLCFSCYFGLFNKQKCLFWGRQKCIYGGKTLVIEMCSNTLTFLVWFLTIIHTF